MPKRSVLDDVLPALTAPTPDNVIDISTGQPLSPPPTAVKRPAYRCQTPKHEDRAGRLTAGGPFCPDCLSSRAEHRQRAAAQTGVKCAKDAFTEVTL